MRACTYIGAPKSYRMLEPQPQDERRGSITPLKNVSPPRYHAKFGHSRSNGTSVCVRGSTGKMRWPLASRLSRSSKVSETDTDQSATYDFLLVIHSNHWPNPYRLRDKQFVSSLYLTLRLTGSSGIFNGGEAQKPGDAP